MSQAQKHVLEVWPKAGSQETSDVLEHKGPRPRLANRSNELRNHVPCVAIAVVLASDTEWLTRWSASYQIDTIILGKMHLPDIRLLNPPMFQARQRRGLRVLSQGADCLGVPLGQQFVPETGGVRAEGESARTREEFDGTQTVTSTRGSGAGCDDSFRRWLRDVRSTHVRPEFWRPAATHARNEVPEGVACILVGGHGMSDGDGAATDILNTLLGLAKESPLVTLRAGRAAATEHTQGSYDALFGDDPITAVSDVERLAAALRVSVLHDEPAFVEHFTRLLREAPGGADEVVRGVVNWPRSGDLAARLAAILGHVELLVLNPAAATPADLGLLQTAGLSAPEIVTVSQIIAFTSFQIRVYVGLALLRGDDRVAPACNLGPVSTRNEGFTQEQVAWKPWITPFEAAGATEEQRAVLPGPRLESPYFRLLALDPPVLRERTATDNGIFYTEAGLPRAERELAAAVTSRVNGCIYCASVHSRSASALSGRTDDVQRLLDDGVEAELDDRWRAVTDFAAALAVTPPAATQWHIARLRELGVDDLGILDAAQASAFFGWANRLMLTLGEPVPPEGRS